MTEPESRGKAERPIQSRRLLQSYMAKCMNIQEWLKNGGSQSRIVAGLRNVIVNRERRFEVINCVFWAYLSRIEYSILSKTLLFGSQSVQFLGNCDLIEKGLIGLV